MQNIKSSSLTIERDIRFDGVIIHISIEDFLALGFSYGDSVNLSFSNGESLIDVPFFTGYYIPFGLPVLVGYQGYPHIEFTFNYVGKVYKKLKLTDDITVTISLNEKEKYIVRQNTFSQTHSNDRNDYDSDEEFANFREITNCKNNNTLIYRSASPCDNAYNRSHYVSELCRKYDISYILDLSDTDETLKEYYNDSSVDNVYWKHLYELNRVKAFRLSANYHDEKYAKTIIELLRFIINNDGPFLFHCSEGKDRTGFLSIIICCILNKAIDYIEDDYMKTYDVYYRINKDTNRKSYDAIKTLYFDEMMTYICNDKDYTKLSKEEISEYGKQYLIRNSMNIKEIDIFLQKILN